MRVLKKGGIAGALLYTLTAPAWSQGSPVGAACLPQHIAANKAAANAGLDAIADDTIKRFRAMQALFARTAEAKKWTGLRKSTAEVSTYYPSQIDKAAQAKAKRQLWSLKDMAETGRVRDEVTDLLLELEPGKCDLSEHARQLTAAKMAFSAEEYNAGVRNLEAAE